MQLSKGKARLRRASHSIAQQSEGTACMGMGDGPARCVDGRGMDKVKKHIEKKELTNMKAYKIVDWWRYEVLKNGKTVRNVEAAKKTKVGSLREGPLEYVRFDVQADKKHHHILSAEYRKLLDEAGPEMAAACDGLYKLLVGIASNQLRKYRGWILDDRQRPLDPGQIAKHLCLSETKVSQIFEILLDPEVNFVEFLEVPEALCKSLNSRELDQNSQVGNKRESPLLEAEAEEQDKDKRFRSETEDGGVREKSGIVEFQEAGGGEENVQPQALPAALASVSGSVPASVPASVSEKPTVSDSDSAPVSGSVSQPGPRAGPGAGCEDWEPLSDGDKFLVRDIARDAKDDAITILGLDRHNKSDMTTMMDIYDQLANKVIGGIPYPLFEIALNKARVCSKDFDTPIAGFVVAMKRLPFRYVPIKRSKT